MSRNPSFRTRQERNTRISRLTSETWPRWEWGNRQAKICSNHMVMLCTVGAMVGVMLAPCWNHVGPCKDTVEEQFDKIERQKENVQHRRVQNSEHSTGRHIARKSRNAPTCCIDHEILQHVSLKATKQRIWILRHPHLLTAQQPHTDWWVHPIAVHRYKI